MRAGCRCLRARREGVSPRPRPCRLWLTFVRFDPSHETIAPTVQLGAFPGHALVGRSQVPDDVDLFTFEEVQSVPDLSQAFTKLPAAQCQLEAHLASRLRHYLLDGASTPRRVSIRATAARSLRMTSSPFTTRPAARSASLSAMSSSHACGTGRGVGSSIREGWATPRTDASVFNEAGRWRLPRRGEGCSTRCSRRSVALRWLDLIVFAPVFAPRWRNLVGLCLDERRLQIDIQKAKMIQSIEKAWLEAGPGRIVGVEPSADDPQTIRRRRSPVRWMVACPSGRSRKVT